MGKTEPLRLAEPKLEVKNVAGSNWELAKMTAAQVARTTENMVAKEISAIVAASLDNILQCA